MSQTVSINTAVRFIGEDLSAGFEAGRPRTRIATVFPRAGVIVTMPGIHATQRVAYTDLLNEERLEQNLPPLTEQEEEHVWDESVDLILDGDIILIRPDPKEMELAFEADELLQECVSKRKIKFLHVLDLKVREAIRRRGERWRISPLPRSPKEMADMIANSRIAVNGRDIYYYNRSTGTRILTLPSFCELGALSDRQLRAHLNEIRHTCGERNRMDNCEVDFFMARDRGPSQCLIDQNLGESDEQARACFNRVRETFTDAVPEEFRQDDLDSAEWRRRMFAALIGHTDQEVSEESLLGLSAEFFMQIEWLPGGRIEEGELILDSVFDEELPAHAGPNGITDDKTRGFIFNFIRDYGDLEYFNIGRVVGTLSGRQPSQGRRGVYVAEIKQRDNDQTILRIIRMQKWGVREHLDDGKDLLAAMLQSDEYTEYILDRRMGCRQLGMNLSKKAWARKVGEHYTGSNGRLWGQWIRTPYFERDYLPGLATDKIPSCRFNNPEYALAFARVIGQAAAPNLIVGRADHTNTIIFDDGDELVVEDENGIPTDVIVADHTGTFQDYHGPLSALAASYVRPIEKRHQWTPNPQQFTDTYFDAFTQRYLQIQNEYIKRKRAFDTLFKHLRRDEGGSFRYRWECVLNRLELTPVEQMVAAMRENLPAALGAR